MAGTIGIKIANGDFYPVTGENSPGKKRLVLTTVHDGQESVQIDLFRTISKSMLDAQYIGSLVVENIKPRPKGEPSIEMVISSDEDGNITADACDLDARGEHHTLNVSLKTLDLPDQQDGFPDFDLENSGQETSGLYSDIAGEKEEEKKFPWLIMGIATLFVVIAIALLWFFFLGGKEALQLSNIFPFINAKPAYEETEPVPPPPQMAQQIQPAAPPVEPPPPRPQAVQRTRPPAPVSSYRVPAVIPRNGVVYQIRWGDTLWDISEAFYRNPWLYHKIARDNRIRNPDFIISGFNVRIMPLQ